MSDHIDNFLPLQNVRLSVEPAEVALESVDGPLLLSSVQSAFPLSTGVYYRSKTKESGDCRVMLKFDGRRFFPPIGGWNGAGEYFVELGGARHNPFPFGSYEQAAKQFERSVNLVQQMMNGANGTAAGKAEDREKERRKESVGSEEEWGRREKEELGTHRKGSDTLSRRWPSSSSAELNRGLGRDFADLARICAGKGAIIEGLRTELEGIRTKLEKMEEKEMEWTERETEWTMRLENGERELAMMRELGREQRGQQRRVEELEHILNETNREAKKMVAELEEKWTKSRREAEEVAERNEQNEAKVKELSAQLRKCEREKADLTKKALILEEQVNGEAKEFDRRFRERERIQREVMEDNGRLYQKKDQLEEECRSMTEKLKGAESEIGRSEERIKQLIDQIGDQERKMSEFEAKIGQVERERDEVADQLRRTKTHSHQGDGQPIFSYQQE
ncbi:hypothetical protein niasHS_010725 [Heterodera schachtii]|uniref:TAR DNA-binding protein 43 N-terminal domain-containing protein n=1 Tax=Heterodera schachtii TaxID=97005 RepID=A0ABD2J6D4_HETSC